MGKLFDDRHVGAVAIVEPPVSQWYARRAQITTLVVGLAVGASGTQRARKPRKEGS